MGCRPYHPRRRDAERRGIIAQSLHRAIAAAELHHDRISAQVDHAQALIDRDRAAGRDVGADEVRLAGLRVTLAEKRFNLEGARHAAGMDRAA